MACYTHEEIVIINGRTCVCMYSEFYPTRRKPALNNSTLIISGNLEAVIRMNNGVKISCCRGTMCIQQMYIYTLYLSLCQASAPASEIRLITSQRENVISH